MRKQEMDHIITKMLDSHSNVSDLNISVGKPLQVESDGVLCPVELEPRFNELTPFQAETFALNLLDGDRRLTERLLHEGYCDLSYQLPGKARFRVNIFSQRNHYSAVLRKLETKIPTCKDRGLPKSFYNIAEERNGLVIFTGATGTGKTTSLAAILNEINETKSVHVITLEDPIEYDHPHKKATFNQREMGTNFENYADGLRAALRQAPKVILVGEMRDRESVEIGLTAAETGHLVLTTLHTVDAGQTINRILGMFRIDEENQIRMRLAGSIRWVVSQRLLPRIGGGRVAAFEIMRTSLRVKDSILHGESEGKTFYDIIEAGITVGMTTFDQYLTGLYERGIIAEETALGYSSRRTVVSRAIDRIKSARGEKTTDIEDLEVDLHYGRDRRR